MRTVTILLKTSSKINFYKLKFLPHGTFSKKNHPISKDLDIFSSQWQMEESKTVKTWKHQTIPIAIKKSNKEQIHKLLILLADKNSGKKWT